MPHISWINSLSSLRLSIAAKKITRSAIGSLDFSSLNAVIIISARASLSSSLWTLSPLTLWLILSNGKVKSHICFFEKRECTFMKDAFCSTITSIVHKLLLRNELTDGKCGCHFPLRLLTYLLVVSHTINDWLYHRLISLFVVIDFFRLLIHSHR